jgi:hypothetical protein
LYAILFNIPAFNPFLLKTLLLGASGQLLIIANNARVATGYPPGSGLAVCNGASGCSDPTGYSVSNLGGFNGGYYDTIGRRFFVGAKVRF